jgi:acyl-CoA synthetase (AMP-forming)/AMP-acid ligase II
MLLGTDTFLMGYARAADPEDLSSIRLVIAGAERVRDDTRRAWAQKTQAAIIEGYGATECSPIIAAKSWGNVLCCMSSHPRLAFVHLSSSGTFKDFTSH